MGFTVVVVISTVVVVDEVVEVVVVVDVTVEMVNCVSCRWADDRIAISKRITKLIIDKLNIQTIFSGLILL